MKRLAIVICALVLVASALGFAPTANAADAQCHADPDRIGRFETSIVTCDGFSPDTHLYVYAVEPDGTAVALGTRKTDASGVVFFPWFSGEGLESYRIGTWTFVVEELGPAKSKLRQATVKIILTGEGDHVSGAELHSDKKVYDKSSETIVLTGRGFAPGEPVTLWIQDPAFCSSFTTHFVDGKNGAVFENDPELERFGTRGLETFNADANGEFVTFRFFSNEACHGTYRYAARGLNSGLGAYVDIVLTGATVSETAFLLASKTSVFAFNDTIEFGAFGFGPNEILNCWSTSPEGRAINFGIGGSLSQIKVDGSGFGIISLTTGSHIISPDNPFFNGVEVEPQMSEGSLGWWALTCKGADSNLVGIARYRVDGLPLTP